MCIPNERIPAFGKHDKKTEPALFSVFKEKKRNPVHNRVISKVVMFLGCCFTLKDCVSAK
jgi:hypothetical protein